MTTSTTTAPDEIAALRKLVTIVETLDERCRQRTVAWLAGRYLPTSNGKESE